MLCSFKRGSGKRGQKMPDITMCSSTSCPNRHRCYRVNAITSYYQSYYNFYKGQGPNVISNFDCFIPIEKEDKPKEE